MRITELNNFFYYQHNDILVSLFYLYLLQNSSSICTVEENKTKQVSSFYTAKMWSSFKPSTDFVL